MKMLAHILLLNAIALPGLAGAHPGNPAGGEFAAWLGHMLLSPDHLPVLILAGLVIALGVVRIDRGAVRRGRSADFRERS